MMDDQNRREETTRVIDEHGYEKKVMRGPVATINGFLLTAELDETIFGWKPEAIIYEGDGMARVILKRKIQ